MKTVFNFILPLFLIAGCTPNFEHPYDFDTLEYYSIEKVDFESIIQDSIHTGIVFDERAPTKLDGSPSALLDEIGYQNITISDKERQSLKAEFFEFDKEGYEKYHQVILLGEHDLCMTEYQDILFFKKDEKWKGVLKICFSCEDHVYIGESKYKISFDFDKLETLLSKIKEHQ